MSGDPGPDIIDLVYGMMKVDEQWSVREDRGFTWWGHRLRQHVWAEPPRRSEGCDVVKLHAESDFLRGVTESDDVLLRIAATNRLATLSSVVLETDGRLRFHCTCYAHRESAEWVRMLFALAVAMQACDATVKADHGAPQIFGGEIDASAHPRSGPRRKPDQMLELLAAEVAPRGRTPSPFSTTDFGPLAGTLRARFAATGGVGGMTAEFPFRGDEPAAASLPGRFGRKRGRSAQPAAGPETALVQIQTGAPHPQLGFGALLILHLPVTLPERDAYALANRLNRAEADTWTGCHHVGGWCADENGTPVFTTFLPAYVHPMNIVDNLVLSMGVRAAWAAGVVEG